ncbi:MAG: hypothetical protein Q4D38_07585, partial [Planctomycetia bacterium]|nr:hypothetical protein [Planctomycetia bacterium]
MRAITILQTLALSFGCVLWAFAPSAESYAEEQASLRGGKTAVGTIIVHFAREMGQPLTPSLEATVQSIPVRYHRRPARGLVETAVYNEQRDALTLQAPPASTALLTSAQDDASNAASVPSPADVSSTTEMPSVASVPEAFLAEPSLEFDNQTPFGPPTEAGAGAAPSALPDALPDTLPPSLPETQPETQPAQPAPQPAPQPETLPDTLLFDEPTGDSVGTEGAALVPSNPPADHSAGVDLSSGIVETPPEPLAAPERPAAPAAPVASV